MPLDEFRTPPRGVWVFVCGPSGAGKDSVIAWARERLAQRGDIVFARRMITRPPQQGSDHEPVSTSHFERLADAGALAWHWEAHGFRYGVSARYASQVQHGRIVVVNGSREHALSLPHAAHIMCVLIAASEDTLASRVRQRGRDSPEALAERQRRDAQLAGFPADMKFLNDANLADAAARFQGWLEKLAMRVR
jgi:ribose 1,5-bisphosphokinase